jgi:MFS family permease
MFVLAASLLYLGLAYLAIAVVSSSAHESLREVIGSALLGVAFSALAAAPLSAAVGACLGPILSRLADEYGARRGAFLGFFAGAVGGMLFTGAFFLVFAAGQIPREVSSLLTVPLFLYAGLLSALYTRAWARRHPTPLPSGGLGKDVISINES